MVEDIRQILDPEFVIPSPSSALSPEFWSRMLDQANDRVSKLGPATLEGLMNLAETPPPSTAITGRDFWKIMNHFMSRGFPPPGSRRTMCTPHLQSSYRPHLGDPQNASRLIDDLEATGGDGPVVVASIDEAWNWTHSECITCDRAPLVRLTSDTTHRARELLIARGWRAAFMADYPTDLTALPDHAASMFPHIRFHADAWGHLGDLAGDAHENVPKLVYHLGALNDSAADIWMAESETTGRQGAMGSHGVTCSPEGSNTRRSRKIALRDFSFDGSTIRCEWHTKLRPNINRIYFAIRGSQVYVGTIVDHLPV